MRDTDRIVLSVLGNIEITRRLDSGGMGDVWFGYHKGLDDTVAVKVPREGSSSNVIARMLREARSQYKLRDVPGVVRIFDVVEAPDPHIVMEYIDGVTLEAFLEKHAHELKDLYMQLRLNEMLIKVAQTLQQAHNFQEDGESHPIIHRDIKAGNILLVENPNGMLISKTIDWGLARIGDCSNLTQSDTAMGSPLTLAPEQISHPQDVDGKVDVWALAIVFCECVTGEIVYNDVVVKSDPDKGIVADGVLAAMAKVQSWWLKPEKFQARITEMLPEWAYKVAEPALRIERDNRCTIGQLIKRLEGAQGYLQAEVRRIHRSVTDPIINVPEGSVPADTTPSEAMSEMMKGVAQQSGRSFGRKMAYIVLLLGVLVFGLGLMVYFVSGSKSDPPSRRSSTSKAVAPDAGPKFTSRATVYEPPPRRVVTRPKPLPPPPEGHTMPSDAYIAKLFTKKLKTCKQDDQVNKLGCMRTIIRKMYWSGHQGTAILLQDHTYPHFCFYDFMKHDDGMRAECGRARRDKPKYLKRASGVQYVAYDKRITKRAPIRKRIRRERKAWFKAKYSRKPKSK